MPIAVLCKVKFESQTRREVAFQSSVLISNCSQHEIRIASVSDKESRFKDIRKKTVMKGAAAAVEDLNGER